MKTLLLIAFLFISMYINAQTRNFIDQPFLETNATVDTLITPDRIYLSIAVTEADTKGKSSVEELENKMADKLKSIGIDLQEQLTLKDLSSNFKKYFLKQKDVLKSKDYELVVYNAQTAGKVIAGLEEIGISNIELSRIEYSKMEELKLALKSKAVMKAKLQGEAMVQPLHQKLGMSIYINDNNFQSISRSNEMDAGIQMAYSSKSKSEYEPLEIGFNKIKVVSTVYVNFKLE